MLAMLVLVYTLNFIDRQIVGILAVPIKADLGLDDEQLGLMGGTAFALFYATLAVPIALVADRASRTWIITVALALWSAATAACGLANNFWQLFLARLGVGVGEAGGVAPSYSLITDYFPQQARARALAVFSMGVPIGSALGIFFGGYIAANVDWRTAFYAVGIAGLVVAPLFRLVVREPARGRYDPPQARAPAPPLGAVFRTVAKKPSFWLLAFGASASSMMGYGLIFWLPSLFTRSFDLGLVQVSQFYGAIALVGGIAGIWAGGVLGDRLGALDRAAYARVPAYAFLVAAPLYAVGISVDSLVLAFFVLLVPVALAHLWLGPVIAAVQHLVPPSMRATASAMFLFVNNLLGIGVGTWLLGRLSVALTEAHGEEALRFAILICLPLYWIAAGLFLLAARRLRADWHA